jgi:hypothetical protein
MLLKQKSAPKRTVSKEVNESVLRCSGQIDLRSPVESLLRDLAFVLHATAVVRKDMETEPTMCSVAS